MIDFAESLRRAPRETLQTNFGPAELYFSPDGKTFKHAGFVTGGTIETTKAPPKPKHGGFVTGDG